LLHTGKVFAMGDYKAVCWRNGHCILNIEN